MPNNVYTFAYNDQKPGITVPAFTASDGVQAASVDAQTLNDLLPIAQFKGTSKGFPEGTGFRMYYNPTAKDVYLCKTDAGGSPLTENGSVTLYNVFKDDVTLDYSMTYKIACNYNQFQIQKAQGEMVADGDQNYFKLDNLFMTDGHTDYDLLNAFVAADGSAAAETTAETDAATEAATTEAATDAETTEADTEAETQAETEAETTVLEETIAMTEAPAPAEKTASGGVSGIFLALTIFFGMLAVGAVTGCLLLVRKVKELQNAPADNRQSEKREKEYQAEIVRLAQENERLKKELSDKGDA